MQSNACSSDKEKKTGRMTVGVQSIYMLFLKKNDVLKDSVSQGASTHAAFTLLGDERGGRPKRVLAPPVRLSGESP